MSVEFGSLNLEDMQGEDNRLKEANQRRDNMIVPMPRPKPGQTGVVSVRILPPAKGFKLFQYTRLHMIAGSGGKTRSIHCPKPLIAGKWDRNTNCPICEYYNGLWRQIDKLEEQGKKEAAEKMKDEARSIKPIERYYYNSIVRSIADDQGNKQINVGPMILSVGKVLHKMIVRAIVGDETEAALGDITHPKNGYDFNIKVEVRGTGKDGFPNYDRSAFARDSSPLGTAEEIKEWVENLHDLTALRVLKSMDELDHELARHLGKVDDEGEGGGGESVLDRINQKYGNATRRNTTPVSDEDAVGSVVGSTDNFDEFQEVTPPAASTAPPAADIAIDDEDFLNELQGMGDDA